MDPSVVEGGECVFLKLLHPETPLDIFSPLAYPFFLTLIGFPLVRCASMALGVEGESWAKRLGNVGGARGLLEASSLGRVSRSNLP